MQVHAFVRKSINRCAARTAKRMATSVLRAALTLKNGRAASAKVCIFLWHALYHALMAKARVRIKLIFSAYVCMYVCMYVYTSQ